MNLLVTIWILHRIGGNFAQGPVDCLTPQKYLSKFWYNLIGNILLNRRKKEFVPDGAGVVPWESEKDAAEKQMMTGAKGQWTLNVESYDACCGGRLKSWIFAGMIAKSPTPAQNFDLPLLSLLKCQEEMTKEEAKGMKEKKERWNGKS